MPERRPRVNHERSLLHRLGDTTRLFGARGRRLRRHHFLMHCIVTSALFGAGLPMLRPELARAAESELRPELRIPIRRTHLDNGLRVVLSRDTSLPTVAICLIYDVGTRDEGPEQRGSSSFIVRSLSDGSASREAPSHDEAIAASGGRTSAKLHGDRTELCSLLPSNALAIGLWLEAERMLHPALTPESFEAQRGALLQEGRARLTARAYGDGYRQLRALAHRATLPGSGGELGEGVLAALEAATLERTQSFWQAHYAPNNAVLAVSGNFETVEALKLIRRHFGMARRADISVYEAPKLPEQTEARRANTEDELARTTATFSGWVVPGVEAPDHYALELAAIIVARGESSRLYQLLVREQPLAREVEARTDGVRGSDLFTLRVIVNEGTEPDQIRQLANAQLGAMARWGPTTPELMRAQSQAGSLFLRELEGNLGRSRQLARFELFSGDAQLLLKEPDRYLAVTREDIQRSVARYLLPIRESRVSVTPAARRGAQPRAGAPRRWPDPTASVAR